MQSQIASNLQDIQSFQLYQALRNILSKRNHLNEMRAKLRADIVKIIQEFNPDEENTRKTDKNKAQDWLNKLVVEYLDWCGFCYSKDVFLLESGTQDDGIGLGFAQSDAVPTLVNIVIRTINERDNCEK